MPYPEDEEISADKLMKWLSKFVKGELEHKDTNFGAIIDAEIKYMLPATKALTRPIFSEEVYNDETDSVVMIYTSAVED